MKPTPPGWPRISPALYYQEAAKAIAGLCRAFGFEVRLKVEGDGGRIEHSDLGFGEGLIMVGESEKRERFPYRRSPREVGGFNTQNLMLYVDDVEAHCRRAREAGAKILSQAPTHRHGGGYWSDRRDGSADAGRHHSWFSPRPR